MSKTVQPVSDDLQINSNSLAPGISITLNVYVYPRINHRTNVCQRPIRICNFSILKDGLKKKKKRWVESSYGKHLLEMLPPTLLRYWENHCHLFYGDAKTFWTVALSSMPSRPPRMLLSWRIRYQIKWDIAGCAKSAG